MNLLVISNNPARASFRQRIEIYLEILSRNGIHCEVAKLPPGLLARRKLFRQIAEFNGIFLHKKTLNFFDAVQLRYYAKKIIYDFDDAVMYSPNHPDSNSFSHFWPFRRTVKIADLVIAGNSYLAGHALKFSANVNILPTGLDTSRYQQHIGPPNDNKLRLVWIGSKSTLRYLKDIAPALERIGSRFENVVLRLISDDFFDLRNMQVEKYHWSSESESKDLAVCDIGLAPLPDDRFTRGKCGFKILQYAAAGLPVVASPVGTNLGYVRDRITGFLATDARQWVSRITQLVENPFLRTKMGKAALASIENLDVSVTGKRLAKLITKCLQPATS